MIEVAMGFGLGALATCLLTLVVTPFIHERAVRLTTQKLFAVTPSSSLVEMQAQQDLVRAEFAMSAYRFESRLAAMRAKETALFVEIAKKAGEISHLKIALDERSSAVAEYQTRERLRRSVVHRIVKLLLWMFDRLDRPYHRSQKAPLEDGLEHVAAPPLQNASADPLFEDEPASSVTERLLAQSQLTMMGLNNARQTPPCALHHVQ
jgi:hypothetical protein